MSRILVGSIFIGFFAISVGPTSGAAPDEATKKKRAEIEASVERGLEWLKKSQSSDGSWSTQMYPSTMTSMAGMAMLMEGSTLREGKYSECLRKAVEWQIRNAQPSGQLGPTPNHTTYEHGFGMLFLASVYGEEDDKDRRKKLEAILKKAVKLAGEGQSKSGGWFYNLGDGQDEGSTTVTVLQGLRACRNAGIPVPKEIIERATKYLHDCTTQRGGVIYRYAGGMAQAGGERPAITAAAVACGFSAGQYNDEFTKKWIKFCKENIPMHRGPQAGFDDYQQYYFAQAVYLLGDDRYVEMFPKESKESALTWTKYKNATFGELRKLQRNVCWVCLGCGGEVFSTAVNLTILQLDKGILPVYHR